MNLPRYPKYKPSGVEWIREVPEHWEVRRLKHLSTLSPRTTNIRTYDPETEISFIPMENIGEFGGLNLTQTRQLSDVISGYTFFQNGDVVIAKITPCFENGKGAYASQLVNGIAFGTTELHVMRPSSQIKGRFLFYLTLSSVFRRRGEAEMYGAGGQKRVPASFIENIEHPVPSLCEQQAIISFLDCQTTKIDTLIAKKRTLIERLKEKRTALITRTVTRGLPPDAARAAGLDPYPKLKPSGVGWIGNVPENWDIFPLKRHHRVVNGGTPSSTEEVYWDGNVNWITPDDLGKNRSKHIEDSRRTLSTEGLMNCGAQLVPTNSIVLSTRAPIGHVAVIGKESCTNQGCRALVPDERHAFSGYLYYTLISSRSVLKAVGKGTTFMELSADHLSSHVAPFPPYNEQRTIADFLDRETEKTDDLTANIETSIERLREYRSAIIDAAVTGKIDARTVDTRKNVPSSGCSQWEEPT